MMVTASDPYIDRLRNTPSGGPSIAAIVMNPWQFPAADATDERRPVGLLTLSPASAERANE